MRIERVQGTVSLRRTIESGTEEQRQAVKRMIDEVRNNGDAALKNIRKCLTAFHFIR